MKKRQIMKVTGISLVALTFSATAATNVWEGISGDGSSYTDGLNWVGGTAPVNDTTTDVAQFTGGTVELDASRSVLGLDVNAASTLTGTGTELTVGSSGLSGTGAITFQTDVHLAGSGGHSGGITVDGATVESGGGSNFGTSVVTLDNGGAIMSDGGHLNMSGIAGIVLGSGGGTLRSEAATGSAIYNVGIISGSGMLTLDGNGNTDYPGNTRLQLQGESTYTGGTLINNKANAVIQNSLGLGAVGSTVTIDDARLVTAATISLDYDIEIAAGGGTISLDGRAANILGALKGTGDLVIDGQNRDNDDGTPNGELRLVSASTLSGNVTLSDHVTVRATTDSLGSGIITIEEDALLRNHNSETTFANDIVIGTGGARLSGQYSSDFILNGDLSGTEALSIEAGSGSVVFNGDGSGFTGLLTLEDGAELAGTGSFGGDLTIAENGTLAFSVTDTLTVGGVVTIDSTFGIDNLIGIDSTVADGTYMLIDGDTSASFIAGFENIGLANAYAFDDGSGKSAYFTEGSLQVTVIPEPVTLGLVAAFGGSILFIRRRFMI